MRPLRIGFYVPSWGRPCGVAEYTKSLAQALGQHGQRVDILTAPMDSVPQIARIRGLDLVHIQFEYSLMKASAVARLIAALDRLGVKTVVTVHSYSPSAVSENHVIRNHFPWVFTTLPAVRNGFLSCGVSPQRVKVIPIGVQEYRLPDRQYIRAGLGFSRAPVIGFFGFVYRHKGIENLVLAARLLRSRFPELVLYLLAAEGLNEGSRQAFEAIKRFFNENGLWEGVRLEMSYLPHDEVVRRLHAVDVNVLPYRELEGVQASAAVRTLLAALRPVIVSDTSHFSDLNDEVLKMPDSSPETIARTVEGLLADTEAQRQLVEKAARYVSDYSWHRVAGVHLAYYRNLFGIIST